MQSTIQVGLLLRCIREKIRPLSFNQARVLQVKVNLSKCPAKSPKNDHLRRFAKLCPAGSRSGVAERLLPWQIEPDIVFLDLCGKQLDYTLFDGV